MKINEHEGSLFTHEVHGFFFSDYRARWSTLAVYAKASYVFTGLFESCWRLQMCVCMLREMAFRWQRGSPNSCALAGWLDRWWLFLHNINHKQQARDVYNSYRSILLFPSGPFLLIKCLFIKLAIKYALHTLNYWRALIKCWLGYCWIY